MLEMIFQAYCDSPAWSIPAGSGECPSDRSVQCKCRQGGKEEPLGIPCSKLSSAVSTGTQKCRLLVFFSNGDAQTEIFQYLILY